MAHTPAPITPVSSVAKVKHHPKVPALGVLTKANYAGTDQGVDFTGAGNVPAIGAGIVTDVGVTHIIETGSKAWHYIIYRITSGPLKGQFVYVAENVKPTVRVGQHLTFGQSVGHALGKFPYIEVGFNKSGKGWNPVSPLYPNPHSAKPAGEAMWKYLQGLAAGKRRVKVNGKWYTVQNGHWVGKGPPGYSGQSVLQNPIGAGANALVGGAKGAATGIENSALKRIIYGVVMVGGILLLITGFAMIGLDLTLGRSSTAKKALEIAGVAGLAGKVQAGSKTRRALRAPTDKELSREYRRGENEGTRAEARSQGRKVARSRIAKPENLKPQPKYSGKDDSGSVPF